MAIAASEVVPRAYDGVYLPQEISSYLLVSLPARCHPPTSRRVLGWIRSGLVAPERKAIPGHNLVMNFDDLVTCQAITLLHEAGFTIQAIRRAESIFADLYKTPKPLTRYEVWHSIPHIFARYEGQLMSGTAPWQYALSFMERWVNPLRAKLVFSGRSGRPICWRPRSRVTLRPDTQFGQPCIEETRIPTSTLWSYVKGGDSIAYVARCFKVEPADVKIAYHWEERRRSKLHTAPKVSPRQLPQPPTCTSP